MSALPEWKRKALDLWPDLYEYVDEDQQNINFAFFELLPRCQEAHQRADEHELKRIYGFAEWCLDQPHQELWNAAGVAFYEHLVDRPETRAAIPRWLKPHAYQLLAEHGVRFSSDDAVVFWGDSFDDHGGARWAKAAIAACHCHSRSPGQRLLKAIALNQARHQQRR